MSGYIVVLAGNTMAMPGVKRIKENGYKVIVVDKTPCKESYDVADIVVAADLMKPIEVYNAIKHYEISAVMPLNDFCIHATAYINEKLNLLGHSNLTAQNVTSKAEMKKVWTRAGLKTPKYISYKLDDVFSKDFNPELDYPFIIKPSWAGGASRGVFLVTDYKDLLEKVSESKHFYIDNDIVLEEFITGSEHTVEVIVFNGKTSVISISDKKNYEGSNTVVQTLYFPGPKGTKYKSQIENLMQEAAIALQIENGCMHIEIMITNKEEIFLLEVGGRPGGGLNFFPIGYLSTGYDYPLEYTRVLSGDEPLFKKNENTFQLGWYFWEGCDGIFEKTQGEENIINHPNTVRYELLWKPEQVVHSKFKNDMERPGYMLIKGKDINEVKEVIDNLKTKIRFKLKDNVA